MDLFLALTLHHQQFDSPFWKEWIYAEREAKSKWIFVGKVVVVVASDF